MTQPASSNANFQNKFTLWHIKLSSVYRKLNLTSINRIQFVFFSLGTSFMYPHDKSPMLVAKVQNPKQSCYRRYWLHYTC